MSPKKLIALVKHSLAAPRAALRPGDSLLVLSHLRSFSTLLTHILDSHPEICGYTEKHQSYPGRWRLYRLQLIAVAEGPPHKSCRFFLDKVLWEKLTVAPMLFARPDVHVITTLRKPQASIESLYNMHLKYFGGGDDLSHIPGLYTRRVEQLGVIAGQLDPARSVYFDAERLLSDTADVLMGLSQALGLRAPLNEEYHVHSDTGTLGLGDPSPLIRRGQIVRDAKRYDVPPIPSGDLERATAAYEATREALRSVCTVLAP